MCKIEVIVEAGVNGGCHVANVKYLTLFFFLNSGEEPYPDITTLAALLSFLSSGNRMPCPDHCSEEL